MRALIAAHTSIVPPPLKSKEFEVIIRGLWAEMNVETPDPDSQPAGILFRHLKEYLNDVRATSFNSFKSGGVLIQEGKAYFVFSKFHEELKRNEWKLDEAETKTMVADIFKGQRTQKRYPKGSQLWCMELDMKQFEQEEAPEEILEFDNQDDIV